MSFYPSKISFNELAENTIVPPPSEDEDDFIQYLNRLYEDIAFAVNNKDNIYFPLTISNVPTNIPILPNFGAFIVCISGQTNGMPAFVWALSKADANQMGVVNNISQQAGTIAPWVGATLSITSTATNFQINHSVANTSGNFNIRYLTTI